VDRPIITDQAAHGLTNWLPAHQTDAFPVHPERWRQDRYRHLLRWRRLLDQLPTRLSNDDVLAMRQIGSAMQLFLWAMAWGFGGARQGYGAWRTDQMLAPPDAQQRVECLLALLADGKLSDAFSALHDPVRCRLPRLGTAFGTKLLYFGGFGLGTVPHEPLVLDAMVVRAFARPGLLTPAGTRIFAGVSASTTSTAAYEQYLAGVHVLRDQHTPGTRVDAVERWLWSVGAGEATLGPC